MRIAKVIVNLSLDRVFDYIIPKELLSTVRAGVQVNVPFGRSSRRGYVVSVTDSSKFAFSELKELSSVCASHPEIPENLIALGKWISEYYCCSREKAVSALLPCAVRSGKIKHKSLSIYSLAEPEKAQKFLIENSSRRKAQVNIIKILFQHTSLGADQLLREAGAGKSVLKALVKSGLVAVEKRTIQRDPYENVEILPSRPAIPTDEQAAALKLIYGLMRKHQKQHTVLLHGVTGSGKTEVYLQAIQRALEMGKSSIVLVPEISLTPQTVSRFRARFGEDVCVMHSMLSEGERFDAWMRVFEGKVKIVVGARSALFAPFRDLGLIIVDEEHENSYKQSEAPRYHARDVAVMRGYMEKAVVVLGSATPSFESYHNALSGKYALAELTRRADNCILPSMRIVDLRKENSDGKMFRFFSKELISAVRNRLSSGEQTILFLNKRGFARQMICMRCGYVAQCPDCSVAYTYHRKTESLSCHLCGAAIQAFSACPQCDAADIRYTGIGTEKIETYAVEFFKGARVSRMDSDTMRNPASYEKVFDDFHKGNIDILIGTQMIAKGLHFPNVTLVGIINADLSLFIPDFRAEERTFQLLTQVAGRAGRGEIKGEVLIQTLNPMNPSIQYAVNHDFRNFYEEEIEVRNELLYPPSSHLIAVHFRGEDANAVAEFSKRFMESLKPALNKDIIVSDPVPAPIERISKKYRYIMIFRGASLKKFREHLREKVLHEQKPKGVEMYVDVDALSLM